MEDYQIQGSIAWHNFRKDRIMASEVAAIMGLNPFETAYQCFMRKLGLLPPVEQNEAMKEGQRLEGEARHLFESIYQLKMSPMVKIHPDFNWLACSLDGISENQDKILEIKCGKKQYEYIANGIIPEYVFPQIQCQIFICDVEEAFLMAYREHGDPGLFYITPVKRNDVFISEMLVACKDFYRRMKEFDPPHPKHRKLENEAMETAVANYRLARDMLARAEKNEQEARSALLSLSDGQCIEGYGLKITHYVQKGAIDYGSIPQLKDVDLDKYRKQPSLRTKIT